MPNYGNAISFQPSMRPFAELKFTSIIWIGNPQDWNFSEILLEKEKKGIIININNLNKIYLMVAIKGEVHEEGGSWVNTVIISD